MSRTGKVTKNVLVTMATQLISWGITFIVTMYLPRYVGPVGLGAITLAGSVASIVGVFVVLGTSTVLVKEIARDHSRTSDLLTASLVMRTVFGIGAILVGWGVSYLLGYDAMLRRIILAALWVMFLQQINDAFSSTLRGLEEIPRQNLAQLADKMVSSTLIIVMVVMGAPIWVIVISGLVSSTVSIGINATAFRPHIKKLTMPRWRTFTFLIAAGTPFFTRAIFTAIYGQSDSVLLSKLSSVAAIGWYGLAKRLGGTTMMIPVALTTAMLPTLSRMYKEDTRAFTAASARLINLMFICVVPFAILLIMAPGQILALLHYPPSFRSSIPVLILMGWAVILWFMSQAVGTILIACDRQAIFSRITGVTALISVPICAASVYVTQRLWHNGATGAVFSDAIIEAYMVTAYVLALPEGLFQWASCQTLARAAMAAAPLVISFYFVHDKQHLPLLLPGLALYIPLCWALNCLHPDDLQMFKRLVRK